MHTVQYLFVITLLCQTHAINRPNPRFINADSTRIWDKSNNEDNHAIQHNDELEGNEEDTNLVDTYPDDADGDIGDHIYEDKDFINPNQPEDEDQYIAKRDGDMAVETSPNFMHYNLRKLERLLLEDEAARLEEPEEEGSEEDQHMIRLHKSVDQEEDLKESENNPGIVVRVTQKGFHFASTNLMRKFQNEINDQPLGEFSRVLMRLNVSILAPRLTEVTMPELDYSTLSENAIKISSVGGSAKLNGKYRAIYKTVREGQFTAMLENFDVNLRIKFARTFAGYLQLVDMSCDAVVRSVNVRLSPKLHEQIKEGLQDAVNALAHEKICEFIDIYIRKIDARLKSLAGYSPVTVEAQAFGSNLLLDTTLSDEVELSDCYLDIPLKGAFIVDKATQTPFYPAPISKSEKDTERMVYVYASDYVINSYFHQLDQLGNFRLNLHLVPEVKSLLRLHCPDDEECIGKLIENANQYTNNTGRMEARVGSPPVVVLNDVGAHVGLNLSVDISYKEADEEDSARAVLMTIQLKIQFHADGLSINNTSPHGEQQRLRIQTNLSISHMELTSAIAYVESMNEFAANLPSYLEEKKTLIEDLVRKNLHIVVPLSVNELIGVNSISGQFRSRTLVFGFDLDLYDKLFEHFSLSS